MGKRVWWILTGTTVALLAAGLALYLTRGYRVVDISGARNVDGLAQVGPDEFLYLRDESLIQVSEPTVRGTASTCRGSRSA